MRRVLNICMCLVAGSLLVLMPLGINQESGFAQGDVLAEAETLHSGENTSGDALGLRVGMLNDEYDCSATAVVVGSQKVKVRFAGNKGSVSKKSKVVSVSKTYGALPSAKRSRYRFTGWYTKKSGGKKVTSASEVSATVKVLYAHWFGPKGSGKTITKAEFNRIKNGMTYSEVRFLIGGGGSLLSSLEGYTAYMWDGKGSLGASASVCFDDLGEVYSKAQYGLR